LTDGALGTTLAHMDDRLHMHPSVAASPEDVWQAMTDPAWPAARFWPPSLPLRTSTDPWPGGSFRIERSSLDVAKPYEPAVVLPRHAPPWTFQPDHRRLHRLILENLG
jgi:hypothetical protein